MAPATTGPGAPTEVGIASPRGLRGEGQVFFRGLSGIGLMPKGALLDLDRLNTLELQLSIGDFGTGYSSFSHLNGFSVQKLEIDRSTMRAQRITGSSGISPHLFRSGTDGALCTAPRY